MWLSIALPMLLVTTPPAILDDPADSASAAPAPTTAPPASTSRVLATIPDEPDAGATAAAAEPPAASVDGEAAPRDPFTPALASAIGAVAGLGLAVAWAVAPVGALQNGGAQLAMLALPGAGSALAVVVVQAFDEAPEDKLGALLPVGSFLSTTGGLIGGALLGGLGGQLTSSGGLGVFYGGVLGAAGGAVAGGVTGPLLMHAVAGAYRDAGAE